MGTGTEFESANTVGFVLLSWIAEAALVGLAYSMLVVIGGG